MSSTPRASSRLGPNTSAREMLVEGASSTSVGGPRRHGHSPHRSIPGTEDRFKPPASEPYDLVEIHAPPANTIPSITLIAVPGASGDPFESWNLKWKKKRSGGPPNGMKYEMETFNWLTQGLAMEDDFKTARILAFKFPKVAEDLTGQMSYGPGRGPPSWKDEGKAVDIEDVPTLKEIAEQLQAGCLVKKATNSSIVFIAISFGGLVVKEMLSGMSRAGANPVAAQTRGVLFFGTPQRGLTDSQMFSTAKIQNFQKKTSRAMPQYNLLKWFMDQSEALRSLDESFRFHFHELDVVTLYETQPSRMLDRVLVDARAATLGTENERVIPVNRDHGSLCRFPSKQDEYYIIVVQELKRMQKLYANTPTTVKRIESKTTVGTGVPASLPLPESGPVPAIGTPTLRYSSPATIQSNVPRDMLDKSYVQVAVQEFYAITTTYDEPSPRRQAQAPVTTAAQASPGIAAAAMERTSSSRGRRRNRSRGRQEIDELALPGESRTVPITTMLEVGPRNWYQERGREEEDGDGDDGETTDTIGSPGLAAIRETINQRTSRGGKPNVDSHFIWVHVPNNVMAFAAPVLKVMCDENRIPFRILDDSAWRAKHRKSRGRLPHIHSHYMEYSSELRIVRFQETLPPQNTNEPASPSNATSGARDVPDLALDSTATNEDLADERPTHDRVIGQMAIYLPYLHWDTFRCFATRDAAYKRIAAGEVNVFSDSRKKPLDPSVYKIAEDYLTNYDLPVHIRRTLDQFFYTYLPDTSKRDFDQRIAHNTKWSRGGPKMIMCDQAWIWVLDNETLATFFTPKEKEDIDTDILLDADLKLAIGNKANEEENFKSRNAYEMAACIIEAAVSVMFNGSRTSSLKFLEIYREVIGKAAEDQTNFFTNFRDQLNEDILNGGRRMSISDADFANEDTAQKRTELSLALRVADVIDELNSIMRLLDAQTDVIQQVKSDMRTVQRVVRSNIGNALVTLDRASGHITDYKREIRRLISDASRAQRGVLSLLELKQKEASIEEQRVARWLQQDTHKLQVDTQEQGIEMEKQGRTILIFTTVTIVFLPLSFFSSWFGQNVVEYTGASGNPTLAAVWAYGGPLTAACVVLAFITAFWEQIKDSMRRAGDLFRNRRPNRKGKGDGASDREPILPVAASTGKDAEKSNVVNRGNTLRLSLNDSGPLVYEQWTNEEMR